MGDASNVQTSFLGGEISPYAQGRLDDPEYKRAMNVCRNSHPIETGAWVRRSGTRNMGYTRKGQDAIQVPFSFAQNSPYTMEFTDLTLRFRDSTGLILADEPRNVLNVSNAIPAVMTTTSPCSGQPNWAVGATVIFKTLSLGASPASGVFENRQFTLVAGIDQQHWQLYDATTGQPVNGATVAWDNTVAMQAGRVLELATPYDTNSWEQVRAVQSQDSVLLLHPNFPPYSVFAPTDGGNTFTITQAQFIDGPYLDPPTDGSFLTISAQSGLVNFTLTYPTYNSGTTYSAGNRYSVANTQRAGTTGTNTQYSGNVVLSGGIAYVSLVDNNVGHTPSASPAFWQAIGSATAFGPSGLTALDIGRSIRLLSEPLAWAVGTAYAANALVKYQNAYYTALIANTGNVPGADATNWGVAANAAAWTWGIITAASGTTFTASIQGAPILYNQNILTYRLGAYANSTTWPTCGTFHENRFWLAGAIKNRFDASKSDDNPYDFTPTAVDGTVSDDNGISETLTSPQQNQIIWLVPDHQGIIMGTAQGEWLLQSSANNDPITPTSIQAHNVSKYGSSNLEPRRAGSVLTFVERQGTKVMEYVCDLFSSKFQALNLTEKSKHLTVSGIKRMAYQQEPIPVLWAITQAGVLIGTTYKRESLMTSQPPNFNGWHRHDLGSGNKVIDICASATPSGIFDSIQLVTKNPITNLCQVEVISDLFDENDTLDQAWFNDNAVVPSGGIITTVNGIQGVTLSGLGHLNGQSVAAFIANLDCGNYVVANGQIFVPFLSDPEKLFTAAWIQALNSQGFPFGFRLTQVNSATGTTIMEYPPISNTFLSHFTYLNYGNQAVTDWTRNRVTFLLPGTGPYSGLVQYNISKGNLIQYVQSAQIFGIPNPAYYDNTIAYPNATSMVTQAGQIFFAKTASSKGTSPSAAGQTDWILWGTTPSAYVAGTTYAIGQSVTSAGSVYKSLINGNIGNTPVSSPADWLLLFATPPAWVSTTTYASTISVITGSTDTLFYAIASVPIGQGDPTTFAINNNQYWATGGAVYPFIVTASGLGMDFNGDIYMYQGGNFGAYAKIDGTTLTQKGFSTANAGQSVPAPAGGIVPIRVLNNNGEADGDYMLETCNTTPTGSTNPACVIMGANSLNASQNSTFVFDEGNNPIAVTGNATAGIGQAYVMTRPLPGNASTGVVGLYEINAFQTNQQQPVVRQKGILANFPFGYQPGYNYWPDPNLGFYGNKQPSAFTMRKAGTIAPTAIDPLWTFFATWTGLIFDPNDGNVMAFVQTQNPSNWASGTSYNQDTTVLSYAVGTDGNVYHAKQTGTAPNPVTDGGIHWTLIGPKAVNLCYFVKLTSDCARVLWATAMNNPSTTDIATMFCDCTSGNYVTLESLGAGLFQGRRFNTLTGATSTFVVGGLSAQGAALIYSDSFDAVLFYPNADTTVPNAPVAVNPTGGTTPAAFTGWALWTVPNNFVYEIPGVVGQPFTSQGQLVRPVAPAETGARNGPAFGKTRRYHRYAMSVANSTNALQIGTDFAAVGVNAMRPAKLKSRSGKGALLISAATLYTGEHSDTVDDDYDLDGMLCWQITRPLPAVMLAIGGMLATQDR